jgi:hypothetical protein
MAKRTLTRLGVLVLGLGLLYGGLNVAGASGPAQVVTGTVTVGNPTTKPVPVQEQGTPTVSIANTTVPVHEQGTANVNVTNSTLAVTQPPIIGGGGVVGDSAGAPQPRLVSTETASAVEIHMTSGVNDFELYNTNGGLVATFFGPPQGFPADVVLTLTRPIAFNEMFCNGGPSDLCEVTFVGDYP